jgi:hypothetical protein
MNGKEKRSVYHRGSNGTDAKSQEDMAKKAIKKFKSIGKAKLSLAISLLRNYGVIWIKR